MDTRSGLVNFGLFILIFIFTFVFCLNAIAEENVLYGVLALLGFLFCIALSVFNGVVAKQNGEALTLWFFIYAGITGVVFVWYCTRCGTLFGWW